MAGSIDAATSERLKSEWLAVSGSNPVADYPLAPDQTLETALQLQTHAAVERNRRLALKAQRHDVFELRVLRAGLHDVVGKTLAVDHPRLAGRLGRIISARSAPLRDQVTLEVWY